ncbi:hypothetical protein CHELA20_40287 [Hyphomicrobiales bacterium]|nr:hypothetical protein CHELA20_40287 [Hyphomicrobiales bacterium]CAH1688040.1 hypothetical protein CHELA41_40144 [Hyphomicrobiales bacterium]
MLGIPPSHHLPFIGNSRYPYPSALTCMWSGVEVKKDHQHFALAGSSGSLLEQSLSPACKPHPSVFGPCCLALDSHTQAKEIHIARYAQWTPAAFWTGRKSKLLCGN